MASFALSSVALKAAAASVAKRSGASRRGIAVRAAAGFEMPGEYKKIAPLGERVLIKVAEAETKTAGGILLAESAQRKPTSGDVTELGPDCVEVKKGDTVLYNKFGIGCTDIEMGGSSYVMINERDLIGTFPGAGATADDIPKLTPLGDRILLKTDDAETTTAGGIMLTEGAVEKPCTATVLATGPGKKAAEKGGKDEKDAAEAKPIAIKKGERVMYFKYAGDKMYDGDGKEYVVLHENDVLAVM